MTSTCEKVLIVDDDPGVLDVLRYRHARDFPMDTVESASEALQWICEAGPYAVIVSDLRMPDMDGIELLSHVRTISPTTVRIALTCETDLPLIASAINNGNIYRFLSKPCSDTAFDATILAGIQRFRAEAEERNKLQLTLDASIRTLSDILVLVHPEVADLNQRIVFLSTEIARKLDVDDRWEIEAAAALSQLGCVSIPRETFQKACLGEELDRRERTRFDGHPVIASKLVSQIPQLNRVAQIILQQDFPASEERVPLAAHILKVALHFAQTESTGEPVDSILDRLYSSPSCFDPAAVAALIAVLDERCNFRIRKVSISGLQDEMVIARDVVSKQGALLVTRGTSVTEKIHSRLLELQKREVVQRSVYVYDTSNCRLKLFDPRPGSEG